MNIFSNLFASSIKLRCDSTGEIPLAWSGNIDIYSNYPSEMDEYKFCGNFEGFLTGSITELLSNLLEIFEESNITFTLPFEIQLTKCQDLVIPASIETEIQNLLGTFVQKHNLILLKAASCKGKDPFKKAIYYINDSNTLPIDYFKSLPVGCKRCYINTSVKDGYCQKCLNVVNDIEKFADRIGITRITAITQEFLDNIINNNIRNIIVERNLSVGQIGSQKFSLIKCEDQIKAYYSNREGNKLSTNGSWPNENMSELNMVKRDDMQIFISILEKRLKKDVQYIFEKCNYKIEVKSNFRWQIK